MWMMTRPKLREQLLLPTRQSLKPRSNWGLGKYGVVVCNVFVTHGQINPCRQGTYDMPSFQPKSACKIIISFHFASV